MDKPTRAYHWRSRLEMLTLDFARPVYHELGIRVRCQEMLRGLARDTLEGRLSGDEGVRRLLIGGQSCQGSDFYTAEALPFLSVLERALGLEARRAVEHWVDYVACSENYNPWTLYEDVLTSWASNFRRTGKDELGFTDPATIEAQLRSFRDIRGSEEVLSKQRCRVLTEWDFPLFARHGLLEIQEGSDFFPFVDALALTILMNRFQDFWGWLLTFIDPVNLQAIAVLARQLADAKRDSDVVYCDPSHLPYLKSIVNRA